MNGRMDGQMNGPMNEGIGGQMNGIMIGSMHAGRMSITSSPLPEAFSHKLLNDNVIQWNNL